MFGFRRHEDIEKKLQKYRPVRHDGVLVLLDEFLGLDGEIRDRLDAGKDYSDTDLYTVNSKLYPATVISVGGKVQFLKPGNRVVLGRGYGYCIGHEDFVICEFKIVTENQIELLIE
jgi:hypothetical protein